MFNVESEGNMAKKVLVVDDEKLIVKGIRFSLEHVRKGASPERFLRWLVHSYM